MQNGHSKSAHSTRVSGASAGPMLGESSTGTLFTLFASKRAWNASSRSFFERPACTWVRSSLAAGTHVLQARFSLTQAAIETGVSAHGARSSETWADQSRFSRGVSAEVSTPSRLTSATAADAEPFGAVSAEDLSSHPLEASVSPSAKRPKTSGERRSLAIARGA